MTIVEFLLARIAEDEAAATALKSALEDKGPQPRWHDHRVSRQRREWPTFWRAFDRYLDPARVLAECEAKRRILNAYPARECWVEERVMCEPRLAQAGWDIPHALKFLAAVYADHPDYQEAWSLGVS